MSDHLRSLFAIFSVCKAFYIRGGRDTRTLDGTSWFDSLKFFL
jgi:hypothetical protein